jgi:hypothetical protein
MGLRVRCHQGEDKGDRGFFELAGGRWTRESGQSVATATVSHSPSTCHLYPLLHLVTPPLHQPGRPAERRQPVAVPHAPDVLLLALVVESTAHTARPVDLVSDEVVALLDRVGMHHATAGQLNGFAHVSLPFRLLGHSGLIRAIPG